MLTRSRRSVAIPHLMVVSGLKRQIAALDSRLQKERKQCLREINRSHLEIAINRDWMQNMSQILKENHVEMANMSKTIDTLRSLLQKEKSRREHFQDLIKILSPSPSPFPSPSDTSPEQSTVSTSEPTTTASTTSSTASTTSASTTSASPAAPLFNITKSELSKIYLFLSTVACVCLLCFLLLKIKKIASFVVNIAHSCLACVKCHQLTTAIQARYDRLRGCLRHQEEDAEEPQVTINLIEEEMRAGVELRNLARGVGEGAAAAASSTSTADAASASVAADNTTTVSLLESEEEEEET